MKRTLSLALILVLALGSLALAQEKVVVYSTSFEPLARALFEAFEEDTGIKVEWVRLSTGEATARMDAERKNPQASMWYGGVGLGHIEAKAKGLTMAYESPNAKYIPEQFRDPDNHWTGILVAALAFVVNTQRLAELGIEAPRTWDDLLKPEFKGEVQIANPAASGTAYNVIATLVQMKGEDEAFECLKKLHQNIQQYTRSGFAPSQNVALGEATVAIGYAHDQASLIAEGYPVEIIFPEDGTGYMIESISLIAGGKDLENAKKLYDWALTPRAAALYAETNVVPFFDVPLKPGAIPISEINTIEQDDEWAAQEKERLIEKWHNEVYR